ncbi:hypothetical protein DRE_00144 [Drechslerella stenobrocha 248]|uniref:Uncharacterized protein n=1 Tax=Drechslerella stenobrocha 248 TaxID=1043628 RepID=W7HZ90_9PEZI|nr:hypothetical protein DRE_00144 [Drechslerella stenobrocha 248]
MRPFTRSLPSRRLFAQAAARFSTARPTYCPNRADLPANNDPAAPNQPHRREGCTQDPPAPPLPGSAAGGSSSSAATATTQSTVHNSATSRRTASEVHPNGKIFPPPGAQHLGSIEQPMVVGAEDGSAKSIEWAQTVGSVKVAYRPVPQRWKDSWVLGALREHVEGRRARTGQEGTGKKRGMGRMPDLSG